MSERPYASGAPSRLDGRQIAELAARITDTPAVGATRLVALDGRGGAGKSTLAHDLAAALAAAGASAGLVFGDDFFLPPAAQQNAAGAGEIGGHFDWRRLQRDVLEPLHDGQPARWQRYDWDSDALVGAYTIPPGGTVIVEGLTVARRELDRFYDYRIWVETDPALRRERIRQRDAAAIQSLWDDLWLPAEDRYVRAHAPYERADLWITFEPDRMSRLRRRFRYR